MITNENSIKFSIRKLGSETYRYVCSLAKKLEDDTVNLEQVGYIYFKLLSKHVWINKIYVDEKYRQYGIGTKLLKKMENFAKQNGANRVEGKFMPECSGVREFYEKNGYYVPNKTRSWDTYDETWTISKNISGAVSSSKCTATPKSII